MSKPFITLYGYWVYSAPVIIRVWGIVYLCMVYQSLSQIDEKCLTLFVFIDLHSWGRVGK